MFASEDVEPPDKQEKPRQLSEEAHAFQSSEYKLQGKSLSRLQLFTICIAQLNEAIQITLPYTVAVYMVRDFQRSSSNDADYEQTVGSLTGILAASFCAAQFISSFPAGRVSDRIGRKPMVVMSNLSSCLSVIGFGLSTNFTMAILFRLAGGFFNCTFVCLKSMIGESCDSAAQARPLSFLSLCWGLGTVVGPSLGGVLSRPCDTFGHGFPLCRDNQLLQARPFFLPCLVVGIVSFVALLCSLVVMDETLPSIVAKKYSALALSDSDPLSVAQQEVSHLPETELTKLTQLDPLSGSPRSEPDMEQGLEVPASGTPDSKRQGLPLAPTESYSAGTEEDAGSREWDTRLGEGQEGGQGVLKRNDTASQINGGRAVLAKLKLGRDSDGVGNAMAEEDEKEGLLMARATSVQTPLAGFTPREGYCGSPEQMLATQLAKAAAEEEAGIVWYKDRQVQLTVCGYTMICLLYNLMDEVTPIYGSAAREDGGLGLSTSALALPLALGGLSIFLWSMFFYPMYQQYFGVLNACRLGLLGTIPLCFGLALPSFLLVDTLALQLILAAVLWLKNIMATNSFTAAVIMVNSKAPLKDMGKVNGASQAAASFVRAIGPALGGVLWGLSVSIPIRGHQLLAFSIAAVGYIAPLFVFGFVKAPRMAEAPPAAH